MSQTGEPPRHPISSITRITEQFPDARYHEAWSLVTWHPTGILDNERADRVVDFLESGEQPGDKPFHRFTDLNGYGRMRIGLDHIVRIARRRRRYAGPPAKSAFYATRPVSVIISRMYRGTHGWIAHPGLHVPRFGRRGGLAWRAGESAAPA